MSRFSNDFRDSFGNKIARHFDKYSEITNPLTFCPLEDVYKQAFSTKEWDALSLLMERKIGRQTLNRSSSFDLYLPETYKGQQKHQRDHVTFGFPDGKNRPNIDVEYYKLHPDVQAKLDSWLKKAVSLKRLRHEIWHRCDRLLDWGWDKHRNYGSNGWYGGPEPGQACNTPGQVYRVWPELLPFLPAEDRHKVMNASVKSPLPKTILNYGTVDQFLCKERWTHANGDLYSDEEMEFEKRKFDALSHILVQMSLMIDVPHVKGYPTVHANR